MQRTTRTVFYKCRGGLIYYVNKARERERARESKRELMGTYKTDKDDNLGKRATSVCFFNFYQYKYAYLQVLPFILCPLKCVLAKECYALTWNLQFWTHYSEIFSIQFSLLYYMGLTWAFNQLGIFHV